MKKIIVCLMSVALFVAPLALPAGAAKKKPKATTFYLHGDQAVGEAQIPDAWLNTMWMTMDTTVPEGGEPKSLFVTNYIVGPNDECSGNGLLPLWRADFAGKFKGDIKVSLHTIATPGAQVSIELFADPAGGCNSEATGAADFVEPVAEEQLEIAPGHAVTEVTFKKVKFTAAASIALQLHAVPVAEDPQQANYPGQVRILYDAETFESGVTFSK